MKQLSRFPILYVILIGVSLAGFAAWYLFSKRSTAPAGRSAAPVSVTVQRVKQQKLRLWDDFSGRLRPVESADIRPEVSGRITEVRFHDGQSVKAGDILVVIEPPVFEAAVARAEARIASAKASLQFATLDYARNSSLVKQNAVSVQEVDRAHCANDKAAAELLAAEADLKTAQVDLDHAYVKAPISGRVSRAELRTGNLVQSGPGAPLLTSIVSEDEIYADFEVDEQTYLETIRNAANGNAQETQIPVELAVQAGAGRVYPGFIQNFDNRLDASSGTIRARAKFKNPDQTLVPGMFVSVHLASSQEREAILIPDRAISFDQSKKFVFIVSPDNKVGYREVELGRELGGQRVVMKGLAAGDRVIVDGLQRVRVDTTVNPEEVPSPERAAVKSEMQTARASGTAKQ